VTSQPARTDARPFKLSIAGGPMLAERGVDGIGGHAQAGISYAAAKSRFGAQLDLAYYLTGQQALYPCIVQDTERCYQTIQRSVTSGVLSATYHISRFASTSRRTLPYVIGGIGLYGSRKLARHFPECQLNGVCTDRNTYEMEIKDTQWGFSGGVGVDVRLEQLATFAEFRVHFVERDSPDNGPSNDYFLVPVSIGVRF
jgi:hypothetical protein